ncbi:phage tail protein [Achromobacter sp. UMC71]|uniref:phage tail protein n=1 Tax=Achromobacter sp. UMC71 TaxID=1862320 RepID=UPI0021069477|nr:phage tail protein [Achromobacter sp. UMC71]MBB1625184.1 hypothetical protein [Achromobacter sp. UMC71]
MSATYFGILTKVGEAKQANAMALGGTLKLTHLAVGDGGGITPTPDREQSRLIGEWRRAPLNQLYVHSDNPNYLVAEQVIPETEGGKWIREWGLYDDDGDMVAVSNCPPTYKPLLAEGSGRTQVVRMVIMVASTAAFTPKIDPAVVLATRKYVDEGLLTRLGKDDTAKAAAMLSPGRKIRVTGPMQADAVLFDGRTDIDLKIKAISPNCFVVGDGDNPVKALTVEAVRELLNVRVRASSIVITQTGAVPIPPEWRGKLVKFQIVGGGGGGGAGSTGGGSQSYQNPDFSGGGGGGGGAGEYKTGEIVLPLAATLNCIVGAGGAGGTTFSGNVAASGSAGGITSLGDLASANGGGGGQGAGGTNPQARGFGGAGGGLGASAGGAGTGEIYAGTSLAVNAIAANGGTGGSTPFGGGGVGGARSGQRLSAGNPGGNPTPNSGGGGGGGGGANGPTNGFAVGAAGASGKIVLELIG